MGKAFDVALLGAIGISILAVMLESVKSFNLAFGRELRILEWVITILFTLEYGLRIISIERPSKYIFSFYGIVDLLSLLPTYLSLFLQDFHYLLIIRAIRLVRIFRIFKLGRYLKAGQILTRALKAASPKITVFLIGVLTLVIIIGSLMYLVEGEKNGFTSIPKGIYWAIVTLTTVGYGDVTPQTVLGQFLSSIVMVMGFGILAVPTGIVSAELSQSKQDFISTQACPSCSYEGHEIDAFYCKKCGAKL